MTRRDPVALGGSVLFVVLLAVTLWASIGHEELAVAPAQGLWLGLFVAAGYLILRRNPRNTVGRLLLGISLITMAGFLTKAYAHKALIRDAGTLPLGEPAAWLSLWLTVPGIALILWLVVVYPTGKLPSERWKVYLPISLGILAINTVLIAIRPGPVDGLPGVENPLGVGSLQVQQTFDAYVLGPTMIIALASAAVSLVIRGRRAPEPERQQIRVLASGFVFMLMMFLITFVVQSFLSFEGKDYVGFVLVMVGALAIPVAIGIALLRYRLYEVDLVVNKTIVYFVLTAFLAAAYFGGVALMRGLLRFGESDVAIAASTLAVAALFHPARHRIQGFIDHNFYRRKYDAQKVVDRFAQRLHDEIDLRTLQRELEQVVLEAVHPTKASVWFISSHGSQPGSELV